MPLSELNVTYGYNTSRFHSRGNHRDLLVLGRMLMGTIGKKKCGYVLSVILYIMHLYNSIIY